MQERKQLVVVSNMAVRDALADMVRDNVMVATPLMTLTGYRFDEILIAAPVPTHGEDRAYAQSWLREAFVPLLAPGGRMLPHGVLE